MSATSAPKARQASVNGVPTKPVEGTGVTASRRGETIPRFTKMALESADFVAKLKPVQPVVFFAASMDERGNIVLDTFVDMDYFHVSGIRVRQRPGRVRASDGSMLDNFSVSLRCVPVNPQYGGEIYLNMLRQERTLPNGNVLKGGTFIVGGLSVYQIGEFVWTAYCAGKYSAIDHDQAGVRRLTQEQLSAKIDAAIAARQTRLTTPQSSQQTTPDSISF